MPPMRFVNNVETRDSLPPAILHSSHESGGRGLATGMLCSATVASRVTADLDPRLRSALAP